MKHDEFDEFEALLRMAAKVRREPLDADRLLLYFDLLDDFTLEDVREGIRHHLRYETFFPMPAEIRAAALEVRGKRRAAAALERAQRETRALAESAESPEAIE